ncbi:hypothetical protein [Enterococcus avium]|uniref:hypothetical protein n=1 Tax=Enterococcus avium TaxID=33945 RepID=UPI003D13CD87
MEEEQNYVPKIIYSEIDGNEIQEIYRSLNKNKKISKGLNTSIKSIGRPSNVTNSMIEKAYSLWKEKKINQQQIADKWGVNVRTVRRKFNKK